MLAALLLCPRATSEPRLANAPERARQHSVTAVGAYGLKEGRGPRVL